MAFGNQSKRAPQIGADRLASVAGLAPAAAAVDGTVAPAVRQVLEPDLSRIRPRGIEETPDERKRRLTAKTVNFTFTIIARLVIMGALGQFGYEAYQATGMVHRGVAAGLFAIAADLGRVILKAMTPGTK